MEHIRCSIVVSISACHAEDPGSSPGGGVLFPQEKISQRLKTSAKEWALNPRGATAPIPGVADKPRGWEEEGFEPMRGDPFGFAGRCLNCLPPPADRPKQTGGGRRDSTPRNPGHQGASQSQHASLLGAYISRGWPPLCPAGHLNSQGHFGRAIKASAC